MASHFLWWLLAIGLAVAEMFTGTFYLLIIALGCSAGGLAAYFGAGLTVQLLAAAVVTVLGWIAIRFTGRGKGNSSEANRNPDVMLDVGSQLDIDQWDRERETRVKYRGALWSVQLSAQVPGAGRAGRHQIERVQGSTLYVIPLQP